MIFPCNNRRLIDILLDLIKIKTDRKRNEIREQYIIDYVKKQIPEINQDEMGNLYYFNKNSALLCAHMDNVGDQISDAALENLVYSQQTKVYADDKHIKNMLLTGDIVGFDDKCGVAIAVYLFNKYKNSETKISILLTVGEETGGLGVRYFCMNNADLLLNCNYCVIPDRTGVSDFIGVKNNYCVQMFEDMALSIVSKFGYKSHAGLWCDANILRYYLSCCNMSCGYEGAHSQNERLDINGFDNCCDAIEHLICNLKLSFGSPSIIGFSFKDYLDGNDDDDGYPNTISEEDEDDDEFLFIKNGIHYE